MKCSRKAVRGPSALRPHDILNSFPAPLLEKDCAVCKDQFSLRTEDPDEQVVITLPCKHPFHSPCIVPWLKQNGTCPSCRYQLVPQPGSTPTQNENSGPGPGPSTGTSNLPQPTAPANFFAQPRADTSSRRFAPSRDRDLGESPERSDGSGGGFLGMVGNLLHSLAGGHPNSGSIPSSSGTGSDSLPGSWEPNSSPRPESGNRLSHTRSQTTQSNRGTYPNSGSTRFQSSPYDQPGSALNPSYNAGPSNRDRNGGSTNERGSYSYNPGRHRQGSYDRERERNRDRQRRNTHPWDNQELD